MTPRNLFEIAARLMGIYFLIVSFGEIVTAVAQLLDIRGLGPDPGTIHVLMSSGLAAAAGFVLLWKAKPIAEALCGTHASEEPPALTATDVFRTGRRLLAICALIRAIQPLVAAAAIFWIPPFTEIARYDIEMSDQFSRYTTAMAIKNATTGCIFLLMAILLFTVSRFDRT